MENAKTIGLAILVVAPLAMVAYVLGVIFYRTLAFEVTALLFVFSLLGLATWIGYTMFREPSSPGPLSFLEESDLDSLETETLNPHVGEARGSRMFPRPRDRRGTSSFSIVKDCSIGEGTEIKDQVNLYKCRIGRDCKIESFVYVEEGVSIGDRCEIKPNVFIPTGVAIEDDVFIGPNVTFTNDKHQRGNGDSTIRETRVGRMASIGAHCVILPGIRIGENAVVGAGSVVTENIPDNAVVFGNPARLLANAAKAGTSTPSRSISVPCSDDDEARHLH